MTIRQVETIRGLLAEQVKSRISLRSRHKLVMARLELRSHAGHLRLLPHLLVIGAQRCGTSSLYKYLGWHPWVVPSLRKETDYFSILYPKGEDWYRAHFPLQLRWRVAELANGWGLLTFEATPDYLLDPRAPARAAELVPDAKIIVLLRDPVDRALSHYLHNRRLRQEPLSFEDALHAEPERLAGEIERLHQDAHYPAKRLRRFSYLARGMYGDQLALWLAHFPKRRFLVVRSEDFFRRTPEVFRQMLDFLGLPTWQPPEFRNLSRPGSGMGQRPEVSGALRERLVANFAPHNRRLYDLLGEDFAWD